MVGNGKRVALYLRVSTDLQTFDSQLDDLRRYSDQRGFHIVGDFRDLAISGSRESRPALDQLMKAARRGDFDAILVWSFSRFSRTLKQLVLALEEFDSLRIDFISYSEAIDTSTPSGRVLFAVIAAFAQFEREIIRERVMAGLRAARARGKTLGRPKSRDDRRVHQLRASGHSFRKIASMLGISLGSVQRALAVSNTPRPEEAKPL